MFGICFMYKLLMRQIRLFKIISSCLQGNNNQINVKTCYNSSYLHKSRCFFSFCSITYEEPNHLPFCRHHSPGEKSPKHTELISSINDAELIATDPHQEIYFIFICVSHTWVPLALCVCVLDDGNRCGFGPSFAAAVCHGWWDNTVWTWELKPAKPGSFSKAAHPAGSTPSWICPLPNSDLQFAQCRHEANLCWLQKTSVQWL